MAVFPGAIWDGDSGNRDSDDGTQRAPDHRDWAAMIAEVAAVQQSNQGLDPDVALNSIGTLATKTGLTAVERGNAAIHKTVLTLDEVELASTDGTTPGTDRAWGTQLLYTFPAGHVNILGAHGVFPLGGLEAVTGGGTGFSTTADIGIGVGTVAAGQSTEFGISTTEENILAEMDVDLTSKTSDAIESAANGTAATYDGSTTPSAAILNYGTLDDADHGTVADVLKVSGTITILWSMLGDD